MVIFIIQIIFGLCMMHEYKNLLKEGKKRKEVLDKNIDELSDQLVQYELDDDKYSLILGNSLLVSHNIELQYVKYEYDSNKRMYNVSMTYVLLNTGLLLIHLYKLL